MKSRIFLGPLLVWVLAGSALAADTTLTPPSGGSVVINSAVATPALRVSPGRLVQVLKPWRPSNGQLLVIFPSRRGMSAAARTLVEFLKANLGKVVA